MAVDCDQAKKIAVALEQPRVIRLAQARHRLNESIEYRLQVESRPADHLEHISGGGLLLQRFSQLVEEARVLDRDHRLFCEIADQLDLLFAKRPHLLAVDDDGTDQLALLEHWDGNHCPRTSNRGKHRPSKTRWHFKKTRLVEDICDVDCLLRSEEHTS